MATQVIVKAEDATDGVERELADNLNDLDAHTLAQRVHEATGETITLTPFAAKGDGYVLAHKDARTIPPPAAEVSEEDLSALTVSELKALAAERDVDVPAKAKKADLIAALADEAN